MSRPRVVFITDIPTPYMVAVMSALADRVALVALFCSTHGTRGLEWQLGELPFRHEIVGGPTKRRAGGNATDLYLSPGLLPALIRHAPEAVICGGFSAPSVYAAGYCAIRNAPLIIHSDGTARSEADLNPLQRFSRAVLVRAADAAAANSEPAAQRFEQLGFSRERIFRALHATNIEPFLRAGEGRDHGGRGELRVLATGRMIVQKGFDHLIRGYALAVGERPGISLRLVGSGPAERELRRLAEELDVSVAFDGFVDQPDLPGAYADAEAYVFPSLDDTFGIVLLEACASGLPVIASPHAGATVDLIGDERSGLVRDPRDHHAVATALVRLCDHPDLRRSLGEAARALARMRTPEATAAGYAEAVLFTLRVRQRRPRAISDRRQ
ncbi:MAG: glycosyltransferase family 4 protein [Actinomycetota bacterium]|nr:glycosyltransferase family 4 protein [Actinomycetota bacterium]